MGAAVGVVASVLGSSAGGMLGSSGLLAGIGQLVSGLLGGSSGSANNIGQALTGFAPANIINATANLFGTLMGSSAKQATQTLQQENGMPKFVQDAVNKAIDKVLQDSKKPTEGAETALTDTVKSELQKTINDISKQIVDSVRNQMMQSTGESSGKKGAKSWLQAIAQAMGEAMGNKAAKMVELSNKLKEQSSAGGDEKAQANAAKQSQATNAEFQAVSQEFKLLTDAFSTALKALGEGMSTVARKQ